MQSRLRAVLLLALASSLELSVVARAERATIEEARRVAENYVRLVIEKDGSWGGHERAAVLSIEPFRREETVLGYYCAVEPSGFFVLGLYKELAPIRAYATDGSIDPALETGSTDMLKDRLEALYDSVADRLGESGDAIDSVDDFASILPVAFRGVWERLGDPAFDPTPFRQPLQGARSAGMNYQEGESLLRSGWHQRPPYNNECPWYGCDWSTYNNFNENALVGCTATAGAQILKYWNWPPYGWGSGFDDPYDWPNICERYDWDSLAAWFKVTEEGQVSPATWAQIDAVAELCFEFGVIIPMDYGCDASSTVGTDGIIDVFRSHFRCVNGVEDIESSDYTFSEYWTMLKNEFNLNRPVLYQIPGHSFVADGWKEEWIDHPYYGQEYYWIHIVYGDGGNGMWCPPQEMPNGNFSEENFIRYILPDGAIGTFTGNYPLGAFPYRYFYLDLEGYDATVAAGQGLQVLRPGFRLGHLNGAGPIQFNGAPGLDTTFFVDGDQAGKTRVRIRDGAIKMTGGGQIAFH